MYNIKLAIRNLLRQRMGTVINVTGLSLSLAVCLLIALFVQYEYAFEKHNPEAKNIYRLLNDFDGERDPIHPLVFYGKLTDAIPELNDGVMVDLNNEDYFVVDNEQWILSGVIQTTNEFFDLFNIQMVEGPQNPLTDASSAVLSRSEARKLFPDGNAVGKTIRQRNNYDFTIRGIYEDLPVTTTYRPNLILNIHAKEVTDNHQYTSMKNESIHFFFRLPENADQASVAKKIREQARTAYGIDDYKGTYVFQPLTDIHLRSSDTTWDSTERSDIKVVRLFIIVAVLVLLITLFNFINLSLALRTKRNFNTGMQKIMGAETKNIFSYLFTETSLLVGLCVVAALFLTSLALPYFGKLMGAEMDFTLANPVLWGAIAVIALFNVLLPVLVQLWYQMRVNPSATIRSKGRALPKKGNIPVAQTLTVVQIAISICLIVGVVGIKKQFDLLLHKKLGFNKENLVTIHNPWSDNMNQRYKLYKQELEKLPSVSGVTGTWNPPGHTLNNGTTMFYESAGEKRQLHLRAAPIDGDFFEVMQTRFLMGHAFLPTDSNKIVINEKCLQNMNVKDPIEIKIRHGFSNRDYEICGVIDDIQNLSLQNESSPAVYYLEPELWVFMVRLNPGDIRQTVSEMERLWKHVEPDQPFRLSFVDEDLQANYTREIRTRKLLTIMSLLAIFISMLGLYGLSMQIIQQRTKEIGIRKVNGATISEVLGMLNKRFLFWVVAAFIIAVPLTYYAMKKWLETFAYKTELSWWVFVLGGLVVLLVALATVSWQSWRAATKNPVEALRYE
jgi:putative ABC transport system permease protein